MKLFCKACGHRCHCVGQGFYVSESCCDSCSCNHCNCTDKPFVLTKPIQTKKSKTWIVSIGLIIFILFGLLGCTKEKYPNKMDSIAKALSKIKK